ncbi:hypothetical protein C7M84_001246 [Penaeus vannamei]|uniref:Uncharacterized protein n=1 Tax=Penaeus vannamei TaxID=6689 RepID=A0A3R7QVR0_PENVA|nr:hypothetical protein C7M84_001246 [Penaeus vannamei]
MEEQSDLIVGHSHEESVRGRGNTAVSLVMEGQCGYIYGCCCPLVAGDVMSDRGHHITSPADLIRTGEDTCFNNVLMYLTAVAAMVRSRGMSNSTPAPYGNSWCCVRRGFCAIASQINTLGSFSFVGERLKAPSAPAIARIQAPKGPASHISCGRAFTRVTWPVTAGILATQISQELSTVRRASRKRSNLTTKPSEDFELLPPLGNAPWTRMKPRRNHVLCLLLLMASGFLQDAAGEPIVAKCPPSDAEDTSNEFCKCDQNPSRSNRVITIKCKFNDKEDVLLTDELYPFRNQTLMTAYVRVENASSVHVTESFLREWQQAPSIALDVWRGGNLTLDPTPEHDNIKRFAPTRPSSMRYLVFEDTVVDKVVGSVATEGYVTLSKRELHSWIGLRLSNVSINSLAKNAFNLTHKHARDCGTGALTVAGDVSVTITGNTFQHLQKEAFKIAVTGDVKFDENVIKSFDPDALEGLVCHNHTSLERNTVHVGKFDGLALNASAAPFHESCGSPQLFMVVTPPASRVTSATAVATWLIGVILLVLVVALVAGVIYTWKTQGLVLRYYTGRGAPMYLNGRKSSQENLPNSAEISANAEAAETGVSNPMYNTTAPS